MTGQLIIKPQTYEGLLSFGIFLETDDPIEGLEHWQDCDEIFIAYSWSFAGAAIAVQELSKWMN